MAVPNFESGKALLLLRVMHLPSYKLSSNIPTSKQLFQQVLQVWNSPNSPKNPWQNLLLPPFLPNFGAFGLISPIFYEMNLKR